MPFDLFISYARRDNAPLKDRPGPVSQLVAQISRDFEQFAGRPLRPFFDTTAIHGMDDWRHRILQGLRESRLLLVCLSSSYLASEYCEWEFIEYLNHEVARGFVGEGVAPLYFVEVPGWQAPDFEQRCAEWVADLRRRQVLDLRPWFNEGQEALRHADVQARMEQLKEQVATRIQRGERAEQSLGNVDAPNPNFIGRTTELRRLRKAVALGKVGVLTAVHGLGGMGKTALAIQYAHAYAHEYGGGRWHVRCEGRGNLAAAIATLAPALAIEFTDAEKLDSDLQFDRVLAELQKLASAREPHHCLLILDNVDQPKLLEPAQTKRFAAADWLHVIATTRLGGNDLFERHKDRAFLAVDELPQADALALIESFQRGGEFSDETERDSAREIVRLLGRFTLAVEAAAVYLGQFAGDVTCEGFLARLKKEGLEGLEGAARETTEGLLHDEKSLAATLRPTLERLSKPEILALNFAALLPADHVALPWIRTLVTQKFPAFGRDAEPGHPDPWQGLQRRLFEMRLWQPTESKDDRGLPLLARMHRLLQELLKSNADKLVKKLDKTVSEHVEARAEVLKEGWVRHEVRWELAPLTACAWQWLDRFDRPGMWLASEVGHHLQTLGNFAESERLLRRSLEKTQPDHENYPALLGNLAQLLLETNRFAEAEQLVRLALRLSEEKCGPESLEVSVNLSHLGRLLHVTNRLAEAEPMLRRAQAIAEQLYGPDHPDVAKHLNNLASLMEEMKQLTEAEALMQRALAIDEKSGRHDHPDSVTRLDHLARLLRTTNRLPEAEPIMRRALALAEQIYGPHHPKVAIGLSTLANLLKETNRLGEVEPMLRRALTIDEQSYGPDHPKVANDLNHLASLLRVTNRQAEAEPLARRALAINEQSYGPEHPYVAVALSHLAALLHETNRLAEAEPLIRRALSISEDSYGPAHPDVAIRLNSLALLLLDTNRLTEAEPLVRRALSIDEQCYGPNHPNVASRLNNLAELLKATNRFAEAEPMMRRSLSISEDSYGPNHPDVALHLNNLALLLRDTNRLAEAEPLMRRALTIDEQSYGPNHPNVARGLGNLAVLLTDTSRSEEAEPLLRRALAIDEQGYGPNHPNVATRLNNLTLLLLNSGRLAEAEPLARRTIQIFESSFGPNHPDVGTALNTLVSLLRADKRPKEAEPLMRRALEIDEQSRGPNHPSLAISLNNLGVLLLDLDQRDEGERLIRRALAINEHNGGPENPALAIDLNNLGVMLQDAYRLDEAEPLMKRAVKIILKFEVANGSEHPNRRRLVRNYSNVLIDQGLSKLQVRRQLKKLGGEFGISLDDAI